MHRASGTRRTISKRSNIHAIAVAEKGRETVETMGKTFLNLLKDRSFIDSRSSANPCSIGRRKLEHIMVTLIRTKDKEKIRKTVSKTQHPADKGK